MGRSDLFGDFEFARMLHHRRIRAQPSCLKPWRHSTPYLIEQPPNWSSDLFSREVRSKVPHHLLTLQFRADASVREGLFSVLEQCIPAERAVPGVEPNLTQ